MKKLFTKFFVVMAMAIASGVSAFGQNGFSYQAVIRNVDGELITNKQVEVRFTLKHDGTVFYSEKQDVKTNEYGNIQVVVGSGEKLDGDFASVPWSSFEVKMEVAVDVDGKYITLGEVPVSGAPYAMYAQKAGGLTSKNANTKDGDALFAVNDANGNPVFAVFADGIVVYVDDTDAAKAKRSGFVVTGRTASKDNAATEYFSVTAEGTQIYVDDIAEDKAKRSGFVVTGRTASKDGEAADYLTVGGEGTTVFVDDDTSKAKRSGFVVTGRTATKDGGDPQYFSATTEGTTVYVDDTSADKAKRSGFVVTGRTATKGGDADNYMAVDGNGTQVYVDGADADKAKRSGFVVTGRTASKAEEDTLFAIEGGYTRVYVDDEETDKAKRSGFVVTGRTASKDSSATNYFNVSGEGNVEILTNEFAVTETSQATQETDTTAVQPQPGDTTETPAPVVDKPKSLFTVSSGNVQVGTEMVMMGDVAKKIEADTVSIDTVEAEFPQIAKIIDRADTVSCAAYKPFVYGNDSDSEGYALLGIYSKGNLAKVSATDARRNTVLLIDADGNVTKRQKYATVAVLMPEGDTQIYIRPLKATSQTISFGLMKKNATEPYQYVKVEAEIETSAGVPYKVVTGSNYGGQVVIDGTVAYGDQPTFEPVPMTGYRFVRWSDGNTRAKRTTTILDDYEISAEFERISYVVAVKSGNELFGTVSGEGTYWHGDTAYIEATPFTGYYFNNWSGVELNDSLQNSPSLALEVTSKLKLIANFGKAEYTITFDSDGGSAVAPMILYYQDKVTAPAEPTKIGYRFLDWEPQLPAEMPAENLTVKAMWSVKQFFIRFDSDGGTPVKTIEANYSEAVTAPEAPTKEGHTFAGWSDTIPATMPANDIKIKALWTVNKYALTWVANGGQFADGDTVAVDSVDYGKEITLRTDIAREGYTFVGWDTVPATMPAEGTTCTAQWSLNAHNIIYVVDGVATDTTKNVAYGTAIEPIEAPEKTGYTFGGWKFNGKDELPKTMPDSTVTITGGFTVNRYTIRFETDGGSAVDSIMADYGTTVVAPKEPTKEGYTFAGWKPDVPATMPAEGTICTAQWSLNAHTIIYMVDGVATDTTKNVAYGTEIKPIAAPTKEGYTFSGWQNVPAAMPDSTVTISGEFTVNRYTIKFETDGGSAVDSIMADYGTAVVAPKAPTKEGYTFAGWKPEVPATMPANVTICTAQWSLNAHNIIYVVDGVATDTVKNVAYGTEIKPIAAPEKTGYVFSGWQNVPRTMPDSTVTISGKFTAGSVTLTFTDENGENPIVIAGNYGDTVQMPDEPKREGYTFAGWSPAVPSTMPAEDATYKATWTLNKMAVSVTATKGGDVEWNNRQYYYGDTLSAKAVASTGYYFANWSGVALKDNTQSSFEVVVKQQLDIVANFVVRQFTATFVRDAGDTTRVKANFGDSLKIETEPAKTGYTFQGWNPEVPATMPAEDMTFTAQWKVNQYTIKFETDGGSAVDSIKADYGTAVVAPEAPTKEGYTFVGWKPEVPAMMPANGTVCTAQWSLNAHTVTYMVDSVQYGKLDTLDFGTAITLRATPTKAGYTFIGWKFNDTDELPKTMPDSDVVFTGLWKANESTEYTVNLFFQNVDNDNYGEPALKSFTLYGTTGVLTDYKPVDSLGFTVQTLTQQVISGDGQTRLNVYYNRNSYQLTWSANGGEFEGGKTDSVVTVAYGDTVVAPKTAPTMKGYTFAGWKLDGTGEVPAMMPANATTIVAQWSLNYHKITYLLDGAVYKTIDSVAYGAAVTAIDNLDYPGHTFGGWQNVPETMPDEDVTVTGSLTANNNTVSYKVDGLIYRVITDVEYGTTIAAITDTVTEPSKTGYTFVKWVCAYTTMPDAAVTVDAEFAVNQYTIGWNANGGDALTGDYTIGSVDFDSVLVAPATPIREGYAFKGWAETADATADKVVTIGTMPAYNVTYYAVWAINEYILTWNANGGQFEGGKTEIADTLDYGAEVVAPTTALAWLGHTFAGWKLNGTDAVPATMPASQTTILAQWTVNTHHIIYMVDGEATDTVKSVAYGTEIKPIATPTKAGYTFSGWKLNGTADVPANMPDSTIVLAGTFEANINTEYTVNLYFQNVDNVGYGEQPLKSFTLQGTTDTKTAYTAADSTGFTLQAFEQVTISGDGQTKLNIYYNRNSYTLTWNADGGTLSGNYTNGQTRFDTAIVAPTASLTGYEFVEWVDSNNKAVDFSGGKVTMPAKDTTFKATWAAADVKYTVEHWQEGLDGNYVRIDSVTETGKKGKTGSLTEAVAMSFAGFEAPETIAQQTIAADGSTVVAIYYTRNSYDLTWKNGSEIIDTESLKYEDTVTMHSSLTLDGYTFKGWSDTLATMPAANTTLSAVWEINQYTVNFSAAVDGAITAKANGKTIASGSKVDYGTEVTLTATASYSGYYFFRWSDDETTNPRTFTIVKDSTIGAVYKKEILVGDSLVYTLTSKTTVSVGKGSTKPRGVLTIPATITDADGDSFSVTSTTNQAFEACDELTSVTIPEGVTNIDKYTFLNCSALTSVNIPNGVTSIGQGAFNSCSSLTTVDIPNSVTNIADIVFLGCSNLTTVSLSNSITSISRNLFNECNSLKSVTIPDGVTSIDENAFYSCKSLKSVIIPESVTSIGRQAFFGCNSLESVTIPPYVTSIGEYAFGRCYKLESANIPEGLTSIDHAVFIYCNSLKSISIPESVTSIGTQAFEDCDSLTSVTLPSTCATVGINAFSDCPKLTIYCQAATAPENVPNEQAKLNCKAIRIQSADETLGTASISTVGGIAADGSTWFAAGDAITLVGTALDETYEAKWTVADTVISNPYTVTDTATITAVWRKKSYPVTGEVNDGAMGSVTITGATDGYCEHGSKVTLTAVPAENYHFVEWSDGETTATHSEITVTEAVVLTATFAVDKFELAWNANGGSALSGTYTSGLVDYTADITAPDAPTRAGYQFVGWATTADATEAVTVATTMPDTDVTYYAVWKLLTTLYVAPEAGSPALGTAEKPFGSIADAAAAMNSDTANYTIVVDGKLTGNQGLGDTLNTRAKSITICGLTGTATDSLYGNNSGTVLTIKTTVPVTVKNLTITGGSLVGNGGGIHIDTVATLTLADGALVSGNHSLRNGNDDPETGCGGGVYNAGTLFMYGSAVIGDSTKHTTAPNSTVCSNSAARGSGLFNQSCGKAYLGYSAENQPAVLTGGIFYNYNAGGNNIEGSGVFNRGTIKMNSGSIAYNGSVSYGAGVLTEGGAGRFEMSGGKICNNASTFASAKGGGVWVVTGSVFLMTGGEISGNSATLGAGVDVSTNGIFTMIGGTVRGNKSPSSKSVCIDEGGKFNIGGSAVIEDTIRVTYDNIITICKKFDNAVNTITLAPDTYATNRTILALADTVTSTTLAAEVGKFRVSDNDTTDLTTWYLTSEGKLRSAEFTPTDYTRSGDNILFGDWPQTIKADGVTVNERAALQRGMLTYYLGSDSNWYVKQYENAYGTSAKFKYSNGTQAAQGGASYKYFKVEPIKWNRQSNNYNGNKLLLAVSMLTGRVPYYINTDTREINGVTINSNNYQYSSLRAYLNGSYEDGDPQPHTYEGNGFLQTAFTTDMQSAILANANCQNDKLFVLSKSEAPGVSKMPTDYGKATYVYISANYNAGNWWLRTPYSNATQVHCVNISLVGWDDHQVSVTDTSLGLVPALCLEADPEVTFNSNGGSAVTKQIVEKGACATEPADPTRDGYTFDGWYGDEDYNHSFDFAGAIIRDTTIYAKWKQNYAKVGGIKYYDNPSTVEAIANASGTVDVVLSSAVPSDSLYNNGDTYYNTICYAISNNNNARINLVLDGTELPADCSQMFARTSSLISVDLSGANLSNVTNMSYMFFCSDSLKIVDLRGLNKSNVTTFEYMFAACRSLTTIYVEPGADWSGTTANSNYMFDCEKLKGGNGTQFDLHNPTDASYARADGLNGQPGYFTALDYACVNGAWCHTLAATIDSLAHATGTVEVVLSKLVPAADLGKAATSGTIINAIKNSPATAVELVVMDDANIGVTDCSGMFSDCANLVKADLRGLNTTGATTMSSMFSGCSALPFLNLSNFNVSAVTDMSSMFSGCSNLSIVRIAEGANWTGVSSSANMFLGCTALMGSDSTAYSAGHTDAAYARIDSASFDKPGYFSAELPYAIVGGTKCNNLRETTEAIYSATGDIVVVLSDKVTATDLGKASNPSYESIFGSLLSTHADHISLIVPADADIMLGADCSGMFRSMSELVSADLRGFNTSRVTNMSEMFSGCSNLESLNLSSFNTDSVTNMSNMFNYCQKLASLDLSGFNTGKVENMAGMFYWTSLTTDVLRGLTTSHVTNMSNMFRGCPKIDTADLRSLCTDNVTDMSGMFADCDSLKMVNMNGLNTSKVTTFEGMFRNCGSLKTLDLSGLCTDSLTNMSEMFQFCENLERVDMRGFNTSKVTTFEYMFSACRSLTTIYVEPGADWRSTTANSNYMFMGCSKLVGGNGTKYDYNNESATRALADGLNGQPGYFTALDYAQVNGVWCHTLAATIDSLAHATGTVEVVLSKLVPAADLGKAANSGTIINAIKNSPATAVRLIVMDDANIGVTDCSGMFSGCANLVKADLRGLNTTGATTMSSMFSDCSALPFLNLSNFDVSAVTDMSSMFSGCSNLSIVRIAEGANWTGVSSSANMFLGCTALMGSDSTTYSAEHTDAAYARIDSASFDKPGYFTAGLPYAIVGGTRCNNLEETTRAIRYASGDIVVVLSDKVTAADLGKTSSSSLESILGTLSSYSGNVSIVVPADADIMLGADCSEMFQDVRKLVSADLRGLNTSRVTNMSKMFEDCNNLESLNLSGFNISRVTNMSSMFESCNNLTSIFVTPGTDWSGTTANSDDMFNGCTNLVGGQGTQCDTSSVKDATRARVDGLNGQPGYFTALDYACVNGVWCHTLAATLDSLANANGTVEVVLTQLVPAADLGKAETAGTIAHAIKSSPATAVRLVVRKEANIGVTDCSGMFSGCTNLVKADLRGLNTTGATTMNSMFSGCSALQHLNLIGLDVDGVTDMSSMFSGCSNLSIVRVAEGSNWTTVGSSADMFLGCTALMGSDGTTYSAEHTDAAYARIDSVKAGKPAGYFSAELPYAIVGGTKCSNQEETWRTIRVASGDIVVVLSDKVTVADLGKESDSESILNAIMQSNGNINLVVPADADIMLNADCSGMFQAMSSLVSADLRGFNTSRVTNMSEMFSGCRNLESLDLSGFNNDNVTNMSKMFNNCKKLDSLDLSGFKTNNVTNMNCMFYGCENLVSLGLSSFNTSNVTDMGSMFAVCEKLDSLDISRFSTSKVENMADMFASTLLTTDVLSGLSTSNVKNMSGMFAGCSAIDTADLRGLCTDNVTDMSNMFDFCLNLKMVDMSGLNTSKVTDMSSMLSRCANLERVDLVGFNTSQVTTFEDMFSECGNLTTIYVQPGADWSGTSANSDNMFASCDKLVGGQSTVYNPDTVNAYYARVDGGVNKPGYFTVKAISYYIDANNGRDSYAGTSEAPLQTLGAALGKMESAATEYTFRINGGLTGQQVLGDSLNGRAKRIIIEGVTGNTADSIDADYVHTEEIGAALTVSTTVPVILRNIKLTGGTGEDFNPYYGGGLTVNNGADVTIGDGCLITNNSYISVYVVRGGTCRLTDGGEVSNTIEGNGIVNDHATLYMTGGLITQNNGAFEGGGVFNRSGNFYMSGGTISNNHCQTGSYGGGVGFENYGGCFEMTGGIISGNTAKFGGAVYMDYDDGSDGVFKVSGGAYIPEGEDGKHDIYLCTGALITITGALDSAYVGTITPQSYPASYDTELLIANAVEGNLCVKFKVTPEQRDGKTYYWYTNQYGKINKNQCRINVPNDAAHPYVLTQDSEYKISSTVAYHPEVYITQDVLDATTSLSYYLTLDGYKRVSPSNNSSFNMYNKNSGVKFYYHITLEGTNSIENSNRAPLLFGGVGDAELIFDATTTTGGTLSLSVTDVSNKVLYFESGAGNLTFKVADGCTFTGVIGETTYSDVTEFFEAAKTNSSASFTVKRWAFSDNGHQYVDLGLTSGTLWATTNVGANSPAEYGDYFAWGETEPYYASQDPLTWKNGKDNGYNWASYTKLSNGSDKSLTKYCNNSSYGNNGFNDGLTTLEAADDAATANWGSVWAMPTSDEFQELYDECYWEWTTDYNGTGKAGYIVYKSVDKSQDKQLTKSSDHTYSIATDTHIFLPAAGWRDIASLGGAGSSGSYWSSSLDASRPDRARYCNFGSSSVSADCSNRYFGQSVRPVKRP